MRILLAVLALEAVVFAAPPSIRIRALRSEYLENPLGIEERKPRLSWKLDSAQRGQRQTAYRIQVAGSEASLAAGKADLWDSGKVASSGTNQISYAGKLLGSRQLCHWRVQVWDKDGQPSAWSQAAHWSMGLLTARDWSAQWISYKDNSPLHASRTALYLPPARYYRGKFETSKPVKRATLYASALGIYDAYLNGRRVSERMFAPGWSDYRKRVYYSAFDVTALIGQGGNSVGAIVADGWYSGYVGYGLLVGYGPNKAGRYFYGKTPALLMQLEIEHTDGTKQTVITDPAWRTAAGAVREADFLMGETWDARLEPKGWDRAGFDDSKWTPAIRAADNGSVQAVFSDRGGDRQVELGFRQPPVIQAYPGPPVRPIEEIKPVRVTGTKPGVFIFDLGQNFSGVAKLRVRGPAGATVRMRFGEMLHKDGSLMTENLRRARATDTYILRGDPAGETWTPRFTYHGFQFVEVTGYPGTPGFDAVTGVVVHSDTPLASSFSSSDDMVNKLFRNVVWTQRSNFVELPTDCPQRDERLGWTGDAQAYIRAATYHADVAAFFTKWLDDLEEAQRDNGAFTDYAPYPMQHGGGNAAYGIAWMDAGVICPYMIFRTYGDRRVIDRHWKAMARFMEFRRTQSNGFHGRRYGNPWGDWLAIGSETPLELIDATYFAYTARLMAEMADATGRAREAATYRDWFQKIQQAFLADFAGSGGRLKVDNQTAYALALHSDVLPDNLRAAAANRLADLIRENTFRMNTGFLGTRPLLPVLTATGNHNLAVRLFQSREFPSWGYEVDNGANTVWERWNSYTREKGFHEPAMNSFSHYAFGAVSEWMFDSLAGIDTDGVGFRKLLIRPLPPSPGSNPARAPINWVTATHESISGPVGSSWRLDKGRFDFQIKVPANVTATVFLPAKDAASVTEGGKPLGSAEGVKLLRQEGATVVLEVQSGQYRFSSRTGD